MLRRKKRISQNQTMGVIVDSILDFPQQHWDNVWVIAATVSTPVGIWYK